MRNPFLLSNKNTAESSNDKLPSRSFSWNFWNVSTIPTRLFNFLRLLIEKFFMQLVYAWEVFSFPFFFNRKYAKEFSIFNFNSFEDCWLFRWKASNPKKVSFSETFVDFSFPLYLKQDSQQIFLLWSTAWIQISGEKIIHVGSGGSESAAGLAARYITSYGL